MVGLVAAKLGAKVSSLLSLTNAVISNQYTQTILAPPPPTSLTVLGRRWCTLISLPQSFERVTKCPMH